MLRISIVILYVISILSLSSSSEYYFPSIIENDNEGEYTNMATRHKFGEKESPNKGELPVAYLYMAKDKQPPAKKQCITCLYELYQKEGGNLDACNCLPCWIQTSKEEEVQKFVIGIFEKHYCNKINHGKSVKPNKAERKMDDSDKRENAERKKLRIDSLESGWRTNSRELKHLDGYINEQDEPDHFRQEVGRMRNSNNKSAGKSRSAKNNRFYGKSRKCSAEDCEVTETTKPLENESEEVEKEKVKKVFNSVLNKMAKLNRANEEDKVMEEPTKVSIKDRWLKNQKSEDKLHWPPVKSYHNQYQKPSYKVDSSQHRVKGSVERNEQKIDHSASEDEVEVISKDRPGEGMVESEIPKSTKSKNGKAKIPKKDEGNVGNASDAIPEDISIGSLVYEEVPKVNYDDGEEIDDEDDVGVHDDEFIYIQTGAEESRYQQMHEKEYTIHYDDENSEEESSESAPSKGQKSFHDTRNTPSVVEERISTTEGTPLFDNKRSEMSETTPCALQMEEKKIPSKSSTTTADPSSMITSEESESTTSSDESSSSSQEDNKRSNNRTNSTETKSTEETETELDISSKKSTTASSTSTTALEFKDSNRIKESSEKMEQPVTETLISSKSSGTIGLTYEIPSESVTETTEKRGTTIRYGKKFTRSTNPTTSGSTETSQDDNTEETVRTEETVTAESIEVDRYLRQTDCSDTASEATKAEEKKKTTASTGAEKQRSSDGGGGGDVTQLKNPRYIVELEEDPDVNGKQWNPEEPILKVKMNIYSDSRSGNVYNFLSKLISRERKKDEKEMEEGKTPKKEERSQSVTSYRRSNPKLLSA